MWNPETATLEELQEANEEGCETLAETECQYRSEVALYGDAWPGAQIHIQAIREGLASLAEIIARRFPETLAVVELQDDDYDIPF